MIPAVQPNALITFAKTPREGTVKTRLEPALGRAGALRLHRALLADAIERMERLRGVADPYLYLAGEGSVESSVPSFPQAEGDLGRRMEAAFVECFARGHQRVAIVAVDSPTLPDAHVRRAFSELEGVPLVLGPSEDGGYWTIGLTRPETALFRNIRWGSGDVLERTLATVRRLGISHRLLPESFDVDRPEDLDRLRRELGRLPLASRPRHTWSFMESFDD